MRCNVRAYSHPDATPERRWAWVRGAGARGLALLAGAHDGSLFDDLDSRTIIQRLKEATDYAGDHPDVWRTFRAR